MAGRNTPRLVGVIVGGGPQPWRDAGFECSRSGFRAGEVAVALTGKPGLPLLVFDPDLDGFDELTASGGAAELPRDHPNGTSGVDHVVVSSPDVDLTSERLSAAGLDLLGTRHAVIDGDEMEQRFHLAGPCLIELVGRPGVHGDGSAEVWGITFVTERIESLPALERSPVASIRDAVQPGRRIATARPEAGLSTRVAFMDPRTRNPEQ